MFIGYKIKHEGFSEYSSRDSLSGPLIERMSFPMGISPSFLDFNSCAISIRKQNLFFEG